MPREIGGSDGSEGQRVHLVLRRQARGLKLSPAAASAVATKKRTIVQENMQIPPGRKLHGEVTLPSALLWTKAAGRADVRGEAGFRNVNVREGNGKLLAEIPGFVTSRGGGVSKRGHAPSERAITLARELLRQKASSFNPCSRQTPRL